MIHVRTQRGFTLLIAIILSSVVLAVGLALLDIAYKQIVLATTAKQSQYAFYNADSALECALYWDQQHNAFDYTAPATSITCNSQTMTLASAPNSTSVSGGKRRTILYVPCTPSGTNAVITVDKYATGTTTLYAAGYNNCAGTDTHRVERGLTAYYDGGTEVVVPPASTPLTFTVSPALSGKTSWDPSVDGPMVFSSTDTWTVTVVGNGTTSVKAWGGGGGGGHPSRTQTANGGGGGFAGGVLTLASGDVITVIVGGGGAANGWGGYNGGGNGNSNGQYGGGGGGSTVKVAGVTQLVAGGGGGGGYDYAGAPGGGTTGGRNAGDGGGGYGGTQVAGGAGGGSASAGWLGFGGDSNYFGGGGGGGYYGGGGAGTVSGYGNGGGGGSSYYGGALISNGTTVSGNGQNAANTSDANYGSSAGQGGAGSTGASGSAGSVGRVVIAGSAPGGGGGGTAGYAANVNFLRSPTVFTQNGVGTARTSLSVNQLTVADEFSGSYSGAHAIDGSTGDANRFTTSDSTNICNFMFRTNGTTNISKITLQNATYPGYLPTTISIQYWDGSAWTTHFTANPSNVATAQSFTTAAVTYAEYWRLLTSGGLLNSQPDNCTFEELQVFP